MKPIAAVIFEGTVVTDFDADLDTLGAFKADAIEKLRLLSETHFILLVSAFAKTDRGANRLRALLYSEGVPFDEIWMGWGFPAHSVLVSDSAKAL